ncbi:dienelactone hydrolase family protein [Glutamicibacter sp. MNS18]|uniref:dienelactone hydrolase family protein n=1 Tax=Glutamicibacter sp. MNS18 TaxID=2989817 RepID=UPI003531D6BF
MADVVLFHHVQGLTPGVQAIAQELESHGHTVHTPDFFDGVHPMDIDAGIGLVTELGESALTHRAIELVDSLPADLVYAGISWGAVLAQRFAQQRPGAIGAILLEGFVDLDAEWSFGPWPPSVPVQIHGMEQDPFFSGEGDLEAARKFTAGSGANVAELFTYPGSAHLFTDSSLPSHDARAFAQVMGHMTGFLARVDPRNPQHE